MSKIKAFTDLETWKENHRLVLLVYKITTSFPKSELFSLTNQMRRSAISITSNIAEGFGRQTYKDKIHFYYMAQGSLVELKNQIMIAYHIKYCSKKEYRIVIDQANISHRLLQGLITKSKSFMNHTS